MMWNLTQAITGGSTVSRFLAICRHARTFQHPTSMACVELSRLQLLYDDAELTWKQHGFPPIAARVVLNEGASRLGQEALSARNKAAELLYLHRRDCALCKRERINAKKPVRVI
jgi:hypothetical protein